MQPQLLTCFAADLAFAKIYGSVGMPGNDERLSPTDAQGASGTRPEFRSFHLA